jgi:hypothetical protein
MAAIQQTREPDDGASQTALLSEGKLLPGPAALSMRLWSMQAGAESSEMRWDGDAPAICLALDIVTASEGKVADRSGRFLIATFPEIQMGILAARRLQWAFQGLADSGGPGGMAVAVLVHCTENPAGQAAGFTEHDQAAMGEIEKAGPGQVLLTAKAAEILQDLPGLPMRVATEPLLCELLWNSADKVSRSADDEAISEFIQQNGLEDPVAAAAVTFVADGLAQAKGEAAFDFGAKDLAEGRGGSRRILIAAGCGVAAVLAIGAVFMFSHKSQSPASVQVQQAAPVLAVSATGEIQTVAQQPQSLTPAAASPSTAAAAPTVVQTAPRAEANTQPVKASRNRAGSSESAKPNAASTGGATGSCGLDPTLVPKMLEQAEASRAGGKYDAAKRQFQAVLNCEPGNQRARSGLDRTISAMHNQ